MGAKFSPIDCKVVFCVCRHLQNIGSKFFFLGLKHLFRSEDFFDTKFQSCFFLLWRLSFRGIAFCRNCGAGKGNLGMWKKYLNIYVLWSSLSFSINIFLKLWHIPWTSLYFLGTAYMQYNWRAIHLLSVMYSLHNLYYIEEQVNLIP